MRGAFEAFPAPSDPALEMLRSMGARNWERNRGKGEV
jgi:hypothetical protein